MDESQGSLLHGNEALARFVRNVEAKLTPAGAHRFWECRSDFDELLGTDFLVSFVNQTLTSMAGDDEAVAFDASDSGVLLVSTEEFSLGLRLLTPKPAGDEPRLFDKPEHQMIGVLGPGGVVVRRYVQPRPEDHHVFDRTKSLERGPVTTVGPGEVIDARAIEDVFRVTTVDPSTVLVLFASGRVGSLQWEYDASTLAPVQAIAADPLASRLEYTLGLLARFEQRSSLPAVAALAGHADHFVRWAAIKAAARLDEPTGLALLRRAEHDAHAHVRNAARRTLQKLDRGAAHGADHQL